jgi:hypothetical protein
MWFQITLARRERSWNPHQTPTLHTPSKGVLDTTRWVFKTLGRVLDARVRVLDTDLGCLVRA